MNATDAGIASAAAVARALAGADVEGLTRVGGGRNSRVYRVQCGDKHFALKQYPARRDDQRERLEAEVAALMLMERHGIDCVPRVIAVDRERDFVLLSWIEGSPLSAPDTNDVAAAITFLNSIHLLGRVPEAAHLPQAAEACLSLAEIERQIHQRVARLKAAAEQAPELSRFLDDEFRPAFDRIAAASRRILHAGGGDANLVLAAEMRSLIPADFGFHNSLRCSNGSLAYVDFEYFGWDDPVKLTADILLHPGMALTEALRKQFRLGAERRHANDETFCVRLDALLPLFTLRWVLILLNEFISERWEQRMSAGMSATWTQAKAEQLARARAMLLRTSEAEIGAKQ